MSDRNFDELADRFASRVHDSQKGVLRRQIIWRDLKQQLPAISGDKPLRILDIGGGLGHFTVKCAALGHRVIYTDLSEIMMQKAQAHAKALVKDIEWLNLPFQDLNSESHGECDLVLCHAVIEWLADPEPLLPTLHSLLKTKAVLSFCFYNPAGLVYRNLICGNFRYLNQREQQPIDPNSLTPPNPRSIEQIEKGLSVSGFSQQSLSGIRVFSDYVLQKRGGNQSADDMMEAEMTYSNLEPYRRMGRYIHIIATKNS